MQFDSIAESPVSPELLEAVRKTLKEIDKGNAPTKDIPNKEAKSGTETDKDPRDKPEDRDQSFDASTGKEKLIINPELRTGPSSAGGVNSPDLSGNTKLGTL